MIMRRVSAQLKMLMDRSVSIYEKDTLRNKIGAAVITHDIPRQASWIVALFGALAYS
jgi:multimeric flavodoxin WrbA